MIVLKNTDTGEFQIVASLDGIDMTVWAETGHDVPADLAERPYTFDDSGAVAIEVKPPLTVPVMLDLLVAKGLITRADADDL